VPERLLKCRDCEHVVKIETHLGTPPECPVCHMGAADKAPVRWRVYEDGWMLTRKDEIFLWACGISPE
jgi:hypothetical protein